ECPIRGTLLTLERPAWLLAAAAFLGDDLNHTTSGVRTVQRCGRRSLDDFDACYVIRIYRVQRGRTLREGVAGCARTRRSVIADREVVVAHTVDVEDRAIAGAYRAGAANAKIGRCTGRAGSWHQRESRSLRLKNVGDVGHR